GPEEAAVRDLAYGAPLHLPGYRAVVRAPVLHRRRLPLHRRTDSLVRHVPGRDHRPAALPGLRTAAGELAPPPPRDGRSPGLTRHRLRLPHRACPGPTRRTARPVLPLAIRHPRPVVDRLSVLTVSSRITGRTADHRPHGRPPQQPAENTAGR